MRSKSKSGKCKSSKSKGGFCKRNAFWQEGRVLARRQRNHLCRCDISVSVTPGQ